MPNYWLPWIVGMPAGTLSLSLLTEFLISSPFPLLHNLFPLFSHLSYTFLLPSPVSPPETSLAICSLIFGGVFDRLPKLRGTNSMAMWRIRSGLHDMRERE